MKLLSEAYIALQGKYCPHCHSTAWLHYGNVDSYAEPTKTQRVACEACKAQWTDTYTLTGYTDLTLPSDTAP